MKSQLKSKIIMVEVINAQAAVYTEIEEETKVPAATIVKF